MLNIPIDVRVTDARTMVGARLIEIHIHDIMKPADVPLLVELIRSHLLTTHEIHLNEAIQDIREFFSSRQYVATVEKTLSDFNLTIAMNMMGHMIDPQLSFSLIENNESIDICMWESEALSSLVYMLC
jgi:hypothetical protein